MNWFSLETAAQQTGRPEATLRRWLNAGTISGRKSPKGKRYIWELSEETIRRVQQEGAQESDYPQLLDEWEQKGLMGAFSKKPISQTSIESYKLGLFYYWKYLAADESVKNINAFNLKTAITSIPVDTKKKKCHHARKYIMYMAVRSFMRYLIYKGIRTQAELEAMGGLLPKRVYPPRKTVLQANAYEKLLAANDAWRNARSNYDIAMTRTALMLAGHAGLRNADIRNLKIEHIDLENRIMSIIDGKGHKNRPIGLTGDLTQQIQSFLKLRPNSQHPHLLLTRIGTPLSQHVLAKKIKALALRAKVGDITMHGLRRTFATINIKRGMPLPVAQKLLGHSDIKTTMEYVLIDEMQAVDFLRGQ